MLGFVVIPCYQLLTAAFTILAATFPFATVFLCQAASGIFISFQDACCIKENNLKIKSIGMPASIA